MNGLSFTLNREKINDSRIQIFKDDGVLVANLPNGCEYSVIQNILYELFCKDKWQKIWIEKVD